MLTGTKFVMQTPLAEKVAVSTYYLSAFEGAVLRWSEELKANLPFEGVPHFETHPQCQHHRYVLGAVGHFFML